MSGQVPRPSPEALNSAIRFMEASARRLDRRFQKSGAWKDALDAMRLGQSAQWLRENGFDCTAGFVEESPGRLTYYHCELPGGHDGEHACAGRRWLSTDRRARS